MFASQKNHEMSALLAALDKSQAVIHFKPDGTILWANDNFLGAMGYTLAQIQGQHHRMFVDHEYATSDDYRNFWDRLNRGEFVAEKFPRIAKSGKDVWIQASYNPMFDANGKVYKFVKFATDITAAEEERARNEHDREELAARQDEVVKALGNGLHQLTEGDYYIGMFMVGAYQEILGDLHNLFGDTNTVHVSCASGGGYHIEHVVTGDTVTDVLKYVGYSREELTARVRRSVEHALRNRRMTLEESRNLLRIYEQGLSGYTYLERD